MGVQCKTHARNPGPSRRESALASQLYAVHACAWEPTDTQDLLVRRNGSGTRGVSEVMLALSRPLGLSLFPLPVFAFGWSLRSAVWGLQAEVWGPRLAFENIVPPPFYPDILGCKRFLYKLRVLVLLHTHTHIAGRDEQGFHKVPREHPGFYPSTTLIVNVSSASTAAVLESVLDKASKEMGEVQS